MNLTMTAQIVQRLRSDILTGALRPGSKLKIEDLRARYGAGSSPIREGLSLLVSDGLVERIDQRGFRVRPASLAAFHELLKTREWLEERALRESIANGDAQWEEQLVLAQHRLSREPRWLGAEVPVANPAWEAHHKSFHLALLSACGSSLLLGYCEQLYDQNIRYRQLAIIDAQAKRAVGQEHTDLCSAALTRDADRAVERLLAHYRITGQSLATRLTALHDTADVRGGATKPNRRMPVGARSIESIGTNQSATRPS